MDHRAEDPQPTATAAMLSELARAEAWIRNCLSKGDPHAAEAWGRFKTLRESLVRLGVNVSPLLRDAALPRDFCLPIYTIRNGKATFRPELDIGVLSASQMMDALRTIERVHYAQDIKGRIITDETDGETFRFEVFDYPPGVYAYPTETDPVDAVAVMICPLESYWKAEFSFKETGAVFVHRPDLDLGPGTLQSLNRSLAEIEQAWRARGAETQHQIEDGAEQIIRHVIPEGEGRPEEALEIRIIEIPPLVGEAA